MLTDIFIHYVGPIVGDFNMPDINWSTCSSKVRNTNLFCDLINECSFLQCNKIPSNSHGFFLDLTLTKSREFISDREELSVDFDTDHTVIGFSLHILRTLYIEMSTILRILTLIYYVL